MVSHGELSQIDGRMQLWYQAKPHRQFVTSVVVSYFDLVTCGTDIYTWNWLSNNSSTLVQWLCCGLVVNLCIVKCERCGFNFFCFVLICNATFVLCSSNMKLITSAKFIYRRRLQERKSWFLLKIIKWYF